MAATTMSSATRREPISCSDGGQEAIHDVPAAHHDDLQREHREQRDGCHDVQGRLVLEAEVADAHHRHHYEHDRDRVPDGPVRLGRRWRAEERQLDFP
jgi:hypothetical protein